MSEFKCPHCGEPIRADKAAPTRASAEQNKNAQNKPSIEDVRAEFNEEALAELKIWETPDGIKVKAKEYWRGASGKAKWNGINELLKQKLGGRWIRTEPASDSHWLI